MVEQVNKQRVSKIKSSRLGVFALAMINVSAILSLRNMPMMAEYGLALICYLIFAGALFFIPSALVSAELGTAWPPDKTGPGGVYVWLRAAYGPRAGFLAVWLQWVEDVVWFPTLLAFSAATVAYIFNPALASNRMYTFVFIIVFLWAATLLNFRGMRASSGLSSFGAIFGTLLPGMLIVGLGALWLVQGRPVQIALSWDALLPSFGNMQQIMLLAGIFLSFTGMEMSAVHVNSVDNPQKNFPRAILLSVVLILGLCMVGSLAIAIVVPAKEISLVAGVMEAFDVFFKSYKMGWLTPVAAFLIAVSGIAQLSTWIVGPTKGLLVASRDGCLPPALRKTNKNKMPVSILLIQGIIVSVFSLVYLVMPSVQSSFWMLTVLTSQVYLVMYVMMFVAAIRLRYKCPDARRTYRVPGGNAGMWLVAGGGCLASLFCIIVGFFPPSQLTAMKDIIFFEIFLLAGMTILIIPPLIIYKIRKPEWQCAQGEDDN
ncbi:MAG: amino acid permease [Spartobacteria bacterium]|nr:amino acid permease [Spartobacteria bacterium]